MSTIYQQYRVTPGQVDLCQRYVDEAPNSVFYLVPSAHEAGLFYKVEWNRQYSRFSCQCKANREGMSCWHVRACLVHATQYAEAKRGEVEAEARIADEKAEYERLLLVPPTRPSEKEVRAACKRNESKPFSILR
jgi:hypothetical protein